MYSDKVISTLFGFTPGYGNASALVLFLRSTYVDLIPILKTIGWLNILMGLDLKEWTKEDYPEKYFFISSLSFTQESRVGGEEQNVIDQDFLLFFKN